MKDVRVFLSENFLLLEVKFSIYMYLNRRVFVMNRFMPNIPQTNFCEWYPPDMRYKIPLVKINKEDSLVKEECWI